MARSYILTLADELEPEVRKAFLAAVNDIKSEAQIGLLISALEAGDIEGAIRVLNLRPEMFGPLDDALRNAYIQGGAAALAGLPVITDPFPEGALLRALTLAIRERNGM